MNLAPHAHKFDPLAYEFEPLAVAALAGVTVTRSGACLRRGIPVLSSHYMYWNKVFQHVGLSYLSWLSRRSVELDPERTFTFGHNLWSAGYYHWMTESVPRLLRAYQVAPDATVLLPPFAKLASVVAETVGPLGFRSVATYPEGANVFVRRLILPANPRCYGEYDVAALHQMRQLYWDAYASPGASEPPGRRIYVSRHKARGRRIVNEPLLLPILKRHGFEVVAFEDYTFPQQVELMRSTEVLISIHGAGLTNMMFMAEGGVVVEVVQDPAEIKKPSSVRRSRLAQSVYCRLASVMGLDYFVEFAGRGVPGSITLNTDVLVDPVSFERVVEAAVERRRLATY